MVYHYTCTFAVMQHTIQLKLLAQLADDEVTVAKAICEALHITHINGYTILKKSMDARAKDIWVHLTLIAYVHEPKPTLQDEYVPYKTLPKLTKKVIIIGAGPAGIFAALKLIQLGVQPIIVERGKDVRNRRRDLAVLNKQGIINPESNYCFGEGGAGTYSDGKLYTRSTKRGDVLSILKLLVQFGAPHNILYEAHPHIGTNKLPQIITAMRLCIEAHGGRFLFDKKLTHFNLNNNTIQSITTADGDTLQADAYILATGHSAKDIFYLLHQLNIDIKSKPLAIGVRIEHPQQLIDAAQYKCTTRPSYLPPASYSVVEQVQAKGVFSFCMCPGGIIATASTSPGELVVNGWSPSKRNNAFANSGMVVAVSPADIAAMHLPITIDPTHPLAMLQVQQHIEAKAYQAGGGSFVAPAQRMVDYVQHTISSTLPASSYIPGLLSANIHQVLPHIISSRLANAFTQFGKKIKGYYTNEAILVATESRTSSPVTIPRHPTLLHHTQVTNLYPCGEGAGYAGGIVSAAMDGEKCAMQIAKNLGITTIP